MNRPSDVSLTSALHSPHAISTCDDRALPTWAPDESYQIYERNRRARIGKLGMAIRLIVFHTLNSVWSFVTFMIVLPGLTVSVACIPIAGIGILMLHVLFLVVEWFARVDLGLVNFISQPSKRRDPRGKVHHVPRQVKGPIGTYLNAVFRWNALKPVLYFCTIKYVIGTLSLVVINVGVLLPFITIISGGKSGISIPGWGAFSLLSVPLLVLKPFIQIFSGYSDPKWTDANHDSYGDELLTYDANPVIYVLLSIGVWVAGVFGILYLAVFAKLVAIYFCTAWKKKKKKRRRRRRAHNQRKSTQTSKLHPTVLEHPESPVLPVLESQSASAHEHYAYSSPHVSIHVQDTH